MFEQLKYNMKYNRRNVMKSVTAWGIFGIIILVFIFWGLTPHNESVGQGGAAAVVNGTTISPAKFMEARERLRRDPRFEQLQSLGSEQAQQFMASQAISQLVEVELLRQAADEARIWTSDAEVAQTIYEIPDFKENGKFSGERYRQLLAANRKPLADFETELRTQQSIRRVYEMFSAATKPLPLEVDKQKQLAEMKANVEYLSLPLEGVVDYKTVSTSDANAFLGRAENEAKIKGYFDTHKQDYSTPEQAKVRHILIRADAGNEDAQKAALTKAEDLRKRAAKEDFAKLATQFTEDPGSKAKGGLIDYFSRGKMVPEFEEVAFSAPLNEISAPIKTQYGYHIIQVLDRKPARESSLDSVKQEIAQKLIAQERSKTAVTNLEAALKAGDQAAIQKFVTENKLKWTETGAFSIESETVPKLGASDEAVRAAFQLDPQKPLYNSLVRQGPTAYVLRYKPVASTKDEKSDASRDDMMREMLASRRGDDTIKKWMDGLRKTAQITTNDALVSGNRSY